MPKLNRTKAKIIARTLFKNKLDAKATVKELAPTNTDNGDHIKAIRWLRDPVVNQEIMELLKTAGIEKEDIAKMINDLKDSKETASYKGQITQSKTIPNDNIRIKLLGILLDKLYTTPSNLSISQTNNYYEMSDEELKKRAEEIDEALSRVNRAKPEE